MFSGTIPVNAAQFEASLDRLLKAHPKHEAELMDYSLQQAFRALTYAAVDTNIIYELTPQARIQNPTLRITSNSTTLHVNYTEDNNNNNNNNNNGSNSKDHGTPLSTNAPANLPSTKVMGREALWYEMCCRAVQSADHLQSLIFLSTKLLCDEASNYGEGNEKPYAGDAWRIALLSHGLSDRHAAIKSKAFHRAEEVNRTYLLGHLMLSIGTLRCLTTPQNGVTTKRLFEHYPQLGESWFDLLLPKIAVLADSSTLPDQAEQVSTSSVLQLQLQGERGAGGGNAEQGSGSRNIHSATPLRSLPCLWRPPSVLVAEANHFIIHSFFHLSSDILAVHAGAGDSAGVNASRRVLDRDPPQRIWVVLDLLQRALRRSIGWIESEMTLWQDRWSKEKNTTAVDADIEGEGEKQPHSSSPLVVGTKNRRRDGTAGRRERSPHVDLQLLTQVRTHVQESFSELVRKQEEWHCVRERIREQFGENANDYHEVTQLMWGNTLRLCFAVQWVTEAYIRALGGVGCFAAPVHGSGTRANGQLFHPPTSKHLLQFIGSCVAQVPNTAEEKPSEMQQFTAQFVLLSAASAAAYSSPLRSMQRALWSADIDLTRQIQLALSQQCLRYPNPRVVQLASQLLGSLWSISVDSPLSTDFLSSTSEQLLDMLHQSRDAASHCVIELVSRAAVDRPHHFIPALFRLLDHGSRVARQNAMDVLAALPQLDGSEDDDDEEEEEEELKKDEYKENKCTSKQKQPHMGDGMAVPAALIAHTPHPKKEAQNAGTRAGVAVSKPSDQGRMRRLLRTLAEHLLLHLHDDELYLRLQGADLFSRVAAQDVVGPLVRLCVQPDSTGRRYNSASRALAAVVRPRTQSATILVRVLEECLAVLADVRSSANSPVQGDTNTAAAALAAVSAQDGSHTSGPTPEASSHTRPVPQSPGDVLPYAMLYSTESLIPGGDPGTKTAGSASSTSSETEKASASASASPSTTISGGATLLSRMERLQTLFRGLTQEWVVAVPAWRSTRHVTPLLECALRVGEADVTGQQFVLKAVLGVLHGISTCRPRSAAKLTHWCEAENNRDGRMAVISALGPYFYDVDHESQMASAAHGSEERESERMGWPWLRQWGTLGTMSAEASQGKVFHYSFPLLCLRRCTPSWELSSIPPEWISACHAAGTHTLPDAPNQDNDKGSTATTATTTPSPSPTPVSRRSPLALRYLWYISESIWTALTHPSLVPTATRFPEFVMVELEILQHFPMALFINRWDAALKAVTSPSRTALAAGGVDGNGDPSARRLSRERGVLFLYTLYVSFITRVIVQRRSLLLTSASPSSSSPVAAPAPAAAAADQLALPPAERSTGLGLFDLLTENDEDVERWLAVPWRAWYNLILPWLAGESFIEGMMTGAGEEGEEEEEVDGNMRRLCNATCELFAALMMFGLAPTPVEEGQPSQPKKQTVTTTAMKEGGGADTDARQAIAIGSSCPAPASAPRSVKWALWWPAVQEVVLDPIRQLGEVYRQGVATEARHLPNTAAGLRTGDGEVGLSCGRVMERYMMAMRIHEGFIQHYNHDNQLAVPLMVRYLKQLAPLLIDTANAAAKWFIFRSGAKNPGEGGATPPVRDTCVEDCEVAAQCGTLLFKAVMLTTKLPADAVSRYVREGAGEEEQAVGAPGHRMRRPVEEIRGGSEDVGVVDPLCHEENKQGDSSPLGLESTPIHLGARRPMCYGDPPTTVSPAAEPQTLLEVLGSSMVAPLASFALGCLRFSQSVSLQDTGVKLFSALIGIAPELVVACDPDLLHSATTVLERLARLHPTPATRQVAEHLLQFLPSEHTR